MKIAAQVGDIQRHLFETLRRELVKKYQVLTAGRIAQGVVDRLFARPQALHGEELQIVENLSNELARDNQIIRDAAFISLEVMLELEGAKNDFRAERRIIETLHWLERFGKKPEGISLAKELKSLMSAGDFLRVGKQERLGEER